ncbi:hypothetical protein O3P69_001328 [Scylla paramamosain]|uniref:Uncharacterized protein n=1 Tax=Scylla paramamosain TaxID=85552 RepID=A0AAW0USI5_SCYPA
MQRRKGGAGISEAVRRRRQYAGVRRTNPLTPPPSPPPPPLPSQPPLTPPEHSRCAAPPHAAEWRGQVSGYAAQTGGRPWRLSRPRGPRLSVVHRHNNNVRLPRCATRRQQATRQGIK